MPHELAGPPVSRAGPSISGGAPGITPRVGNQKRGVLSRIGQGLVSFGSGIPSAEIDTIRSQRDIAANQAQIGQQQIEANQADVLRQQRLQELQQMISGGDPAQRNQSLAQLSVEFPEMFEQISENAGLITQGQKNEAADFALRVRNTPFDQRQPLIDQRITKLVSEGRDPQHTASLTGLPQDQMDISLRATELLALSPDQRLTAARGGLTSETRTAAARAAAGEFTPEEIRQQARIEAGILPRAGLSAQERIATDPTLTTQVAGAQAFIAGATQLAKTEAQITTELRNAGATAAAAASQAALVERALTGERIAAGRLKTAEQARVLLPDAQAGANEMVALLNDIRNDPLLPNVLGAVEGRIDVRLDENESALIAKIDQVLGKTFLEAYQSLKGGGPITDREGQAATEAQSRLTNRVVSLSSYQGAIDELIGITDARLARLTRKANVPAAPTTAPEDTDTFDPALLEFMTPEDRALFEQ